jgi:hypothetical protein
VNILGGGSNGHCAKKVYMNMYLILNGYRDRAVCMYKYKRIGMVIKKEKLLSI